MELDIIDFEILSSLLGDARKPAREIAEETGKHLSTITRRIKTLENKKIIKYYTTVLDYEELGLDITAIIHLALSKGRALDVEEEIAAMPEVCTLYNVTGRFDAVVIAKFFKKAELAQFTKKLRNLPYVDRTETMIALNTFKEDFRLSKIIEKLK